MMRLDVQPTLNLELDFENRIIEVSVMEIFPSICSPYQITIAKDKLVKKVLLLLFNFRINKENFSIYVSKRSFNFSFVMYFILFIFVKSLASKYKEYNKTLFYFPDGISLENISMQLIQLFLH